MIETVFGLLVLFQVKHFLADYPLQGQYMLGKFRDDWGFVPPLLAHVAVHATFTFTICNLYGSGLGKALALAAFDAGVHFVMDRVKAGRRYMGRWKPLTAPDWMKYKGWIDGWAKSENNLQEFMDARRHLRGNRLFWIALGFDQAVHHLTDLAVVWFLVRP